MMRVKMLMMVLAASFLVATFTSAQQDEEEIRPIVLQGIQLFQQQKVDEAIGTLKRAIEEDPNDPVAHNALGVVYSNLGNFEGALECFNKAISLRNPYFKAIYNKFNLLLNTDRFDEAVKLIEGVVEQYPDHADGWINLGVLYGQQGEIDKANEYFDKAIALNSNDYDALFKKGQLMILQKRYEEALTLFQRAAEIAPNFRPATQGVKAVADIIEKKQQGYIRVRQIFVRDPEVAQRIKAELDKGTDFALLASRLSSDPSSKFGGDLGFVKRGELVGEVENVIFELEVGEVSQIVRTARGFHIFKREE